MIELDTNEDDSFGAYEAPMPRDSHLANKLQNEMQQLMEEQEKTHKAFNDKMKIEFSDKLDASNKRALKIEEDVQQINN